MGKAKLRPVEWPFIGVEVEALGWGNRWVRLHWDADAKCLAGTFGPMPFTGVIRVRALGGRGRRKEGEEASAWLHQQGYMRVSSL